MTCLMCTEVEVIQTELSIYHIISILYALTTPNLIQFSH